MNKLLVSLVCGILLSCIGSSCGANSRSKRVHEATGTLPEFPRIDVTTPERFLNDLMLSPLWKVEKLRDGSFIAKARSIVSGGPSADEGGEYLFEFLATPGKGLPKDYRIQDRYLHGRKTFSFFSISVLFKKPDLQSVTLGESAQKVTLGIYESFENKLGLNSSSELAIKLSPQHEIYLILREQGTDPARTETFAKVPRVLRELADIASSPKNYRVEDRCSAFFALFFKTPLKEQEIERFPGIQDRDTFYGYFRAKADTSYNGINIKISHPVYCPDEGTRKSDRLGKAEYLGVPYQEKDLLFFLLEDNAVYLSGEFDERFGTFSGKESFEGTVEVLNDRGATLLKTMGKFKGWQR